MIMVDFEKYMHLETDVIHQKSDIHVAQLTIVPNRFQSKHPVHSRRTQVQETMSNIVQSA